jgi:SecD/SecF fusion protein
MNNYLFAADIPLTGETSVLRSIVTTVVILAVLIVPFLLGWLMAKSLRMKDYRWKFGLILWTIAVACVVIGRTWDPEKKRFDIPLGVDLQGGVILIYEVDRSVKVVDDTKANPSGDPTPQLGTGEFSMSALVEALSRRINPSGTKEIVVRPYGQGQVEIIIPEVDHREVEQIKKVISLRRRRRFRGPVGPSRAGAGFPPRSASL